MISIKFKDTVRGKPGHVADAEIYFLDGELEGLRLVGFGVWEKDGHRSVTYPSREYTVNGQRRQYALLRPVSIIYPSRGNGLAGEILEAYDEHVRASGRVPTAAATP